MDIKGNQKEEYINQYRKSLFDTVKEFCGSITATQTTKIEQLVTARREKIADDFEFGIDIGGLITYTIFPHRASVFKFCGGCTNCRSLESNSIKSTACRCAGGIFMPS